MNQCIDLDTERAKDFGFTSDRFEGYLWERDGCVMISFVVSLRRGNFRDLCERILSHGLTVKIPTPLGRMQAIVRNAGYRETREYDRHSGDYVEVWVKESGIVR